MVLFLLMVSPRPSLLGRRVFDCFIELPFERDVLSAFFSEYSLNILMAASLFGLVGDCQLFSIFSLFRYLSLAFLYR
jgi:hypothetical protein